MESCDLRLQWATPENVMGTIDIPNTIAIVIDSGNAEARYIYFIQTTIFMWWTQNSDNLVIVPWNKK